MQTRLINTARIEAKDGHFTRKEIIKLLSNVKYHSHPLFTSKLLKFGIIEKTSRGYYKFAEKPAYHGVVETMFKELKEYTSSKNKKYKSPITKNKEQEAINYLLATGNYEIYRVTTRTVVDKELLTITNQE